ncbi:ANTAR domain-containing protein [Streptomyces sp. NPDC002564]|uniref:ANTAR domain-containing protein n=1 Tax=Streptomyces sp. NPDC002564 TaxID=3364649 RepID=UPI0036BAE85C
MLATSGMTQVLRSVHHGHVKHLARDATRALGAAGVVISLVTTSGVSTEPVWCFPEISAQFEELQFTLGQGPGLDAVRHAVPVLVPDLGAVRAERWPVLLPAARELGVQGVYCFPLGVGAISVGVLIILCSARQQPLTSRQYADATALAAVLTAHLLSSHAEDSARDGAPPSLTGPPHDLRRAVVHQATGMVSAQLGVPLDEALVRLRGYAFRAEETLTTVAGGVVARRLRFNHDGNGPDSPDEGKGG